MPCATSLLQQFFIDILKELINRTSIVRDELPSPPGSTGLSPAGNWDRLLPPRDPNSGRASFLYERWLEVDQGEIFHLSDLFVYCPHCPHIVHLYQVPEVASASPATHKLCSRTPLRDKEADGWMEIYELDMNQYHFNHLSLIRFPRAAGA